MRRTALATLPLLASLAVAQPTHYTAYPIDDLHGFFGHWAFFGALVYNSPPIYGSDEARCQELVLAHNLPANGALITGIEVAAHFFGQITYSTLEIRVGHSPVQALTPFFAVNSPSPQLVYAAPANHTINWNSTTQWVPFQFQTPFLYSAGSNLVLELKKIINRGMTTSGTVSHQMQNGPMRNDLPTPMWAEGPLGSGAANAASGALYGGPPMLVRFRYANEPTLTITSTPPGGTYFRLGATVTLTVQGNPGELFVNTLDVALGSPPQLIPPINGYYYLQAVFNLMFVGVVGGGGTGPFSFTIPNAPGLVGTHAYFQSLTAGTSITWTNAVDAIVQP
jgi:hypothetical protein